MKKVFVIALLAFVVALTGCNSKKEDELNQKKSELSELSELENKLDNQLSKIEEQSKRLENELKSMEASLIDLSDKNLYENHNISYSLNFKDGGFNTKIYPTPENENEIYTLQKNDELLVTNIIKVKETDKVFIKVKLISDTPLEGFVYLGKNPYENGNFEPVELLKVDGNEIQTLKLDSSFLVSEGVCIRELPSEKSNNLHEITHKEGAGYYKSLEITSDYQWVKITLNEYTGWVPADSLSRDAGGPSIYTPEITIHWNLIDSNLI